jgi:hypothetical protein
MAAQAWLYVMAFQNLISRFQKPPPQDRDELPAVDIRPYYSSVECGGRALALANMTPPRRADPGRKLFPGQPSRSRTLG